MISLLVPTRGRPDNMQRFVETLYETASALPEVLFYIDDDDGSSIEKARLIEGIIPSVQHVIGPRITMSQCWNEVAKVSVGTILGVMGDDIVFRTDNWDDRIEQAFSGYPDQIVMVHGRDGIHDARFGTHCFVSRRWYVACGELFPGIYEAEWVDSHLNDVANALGRRVYLDDVYTEHCHPAANKAPMDTTYIEKGQRHLAQNTNAVYAANGATRERDIAILRELMEGTE